MVDQKVKITTINKNKNIKIGAYLPAKAPIAAFSGSLRSRRAWQKFKTSQNFAYITEKCWIIIMQEIIW